MKYEKFINNRNKQRYIALFTALCCDDKCHCGGEKVVVYKNFKDEMFTMHEKEFLEKFVKGDD